MKRKIKICDQVSKRTAVFQMKLDRQPKVKIEPEKDESSKSESSIPDFDKTAKSPISKNNEKYGSAPNDSQPI